MGSSTGNESANQRKRKYYAVARGRNPGIYDTWAKAKEQVFSFPDAKHKSFSTIAEAERFLRQIGKEGEEDDFDENSALAQTTKKKKKTMTQSATTATGSALNQRKMSTSSTLMSSKQKTIKEYANDDGLEWAEKFEPTKPVDFVAVESVKATTTKSADGSNKRKMSTTTTTTEQTSNKVEQINNQTYVLEFDGASRGNPGPAGAGALIRAPQRDGAIIDDSAVIKGEIIKEICTSLGVATVNEAEYHALLTGLKAAIELGVENIRVRGDSNLIVSQVKGVWKVKEPRLIPLHAECAMLKRKFKAFDIAHVRREYNKDADALANSAIDDGTHTNDYNKTTTTSNSNNDNSNDSNGGGYSGGGGEGLGNNGTSAAMRMMRRAHYSANVARASLCTMRFARIALALL